MKLRDITIGQVSPTESVFLIPYINQSIKQNFPLVNGVLHRISCTWLAQHQVRNSPRLLITLYLHMKLNKYVKN